MTKAELVASICGEVGGFTKKEAAVLADVVFNVMKEALARGDNLKLSGFGTFSVKSKKPRIGRNPRSGTE
ncbi:MAG: HU family DNA-binding protein, partial [Deltaproteobacteria bacterium]|nr:HU family DNA-binding protein [Deltaproteobacteria bacterium]